VQPLKPLELHFLGTGGGRFVMVTQRRRTAGIRVVHGETQVHIDPGPGALVFSNWAKLSPRRLDGLVVTHCHPDHYADAEVFIEAMTDGTRSRKGVFAAPPSVTRGLGGLGQCVSDYHKGLVGELVELEPGTEFRVDELEFTGTKALHSDPSSTGVRFNAPGVGSVGYTCDTGYFEGLSEQHEGERLLILCVIWPRNRKIKMHLCTDGALRVIREARPSSAIITHFGWGMLEADPVEEAAYLQREAGIPVVAAEDGMKATLGERLVIQGPRKRDEPLVFDV